MKPGNRSAKTGVVPIPADDRKGRPKDEARLKTPFPSSPKAGFVLRPAPLPAAGAGFGRRSQMRSPSALTGALLRPAPLPAAGAGFGRRSQMRSPSALTGAE